jgi:hypothetical protein
LRIRLLLHEPGKRSVEVRNRKSQGGATFLLRRDPADLRGLATSATLHRPRGSAKRPLRALSGAFLTLRALSTLDFGGTIWYPLI